MKLVDIEQYKITKENKEFFAVDNTFTVFAESIGFRCRYRDAFSNKIPCRTF
jgi:hypothetical protein